MKRITDKEDIPTTDFRLPKYSDLKTGIMLNLQSNFAPQLPNVQVSDTIADAMKYFSSPHNPFTVLRTSTLPFPHYQLAHTTYADKLPAR
jgi:hypothetical protein